MFNQIFNTGMLALALGTLACASSGGPNLGDSRDTCRLVTATLGGISGLVIAHQGEGETDERLVGISLGGLAGAALGTLICGEGGGISIQTAQIRANPDTGDVPLEVALIGQVSPPDAKVSYAWDLGDGTRAEGSRVRHTYMKADSFDVLLTVTDASGNTKQASARIDARAAPAQVSTRAEPPVQRKMVLRGSNFAFGSAAVTPDESTVLDVAVEELKAQPAGRVRIEGATDSFGSTAYNQDLSERRADAVARHLVAHGIDRGRLETSGSGESEPVASNETDDGRAQNRRVELDLIE